MAGAEFIADRAAPAYVDSARASARLADGVIDDSGGLVRITSGSRVPYFSWLYVTDDGVSDEQLRDAVDWFDSRDQPFTVRLRAHQAPRYDAALRTAGFVSELAMPGMVCAAELTPSPASVELVIDEVADRATYDAFTAAIVPDDPDHWLTTAVYRELMPYPPVVDDARLRLLIGSVGGACVATAGVYVAEGVAVVFAVSTRADVRRRGIGAAMTAAAVEWGRGQGADLAFLTSSEMAMSLYSSMGFRTVDTWHFYLRPWPPRAI